MIKKKFLSPKAEQTAIAPKSNDPVSPIKIFAGWILKHKKADDIPIIIREITEEDTLNPTVKEKKDETNGQGDTWGKSVYSVSKICAVDDSKNNENRKRVVE